MTFITGHLPEPGDLVAYTNIDVEHRGAMFNAIHYAYDTRGHERQYFVTSGPVQKRPLAEVRKELAYAVPGMNVMGFVDEVETGAGRCHVLIEETPIGSPLSELDRPMSAGAAARLLAQTATFVAGAHARGITVYGVRPELVWASGWLIEPEVFDRQVEIEGLTPRAMRFLLGMPAMRGGLCLEDAYSPREVWAGEARGEAVDVFGLCALGYFLLTARAPFPAEGDFNRPIREVMSGAQPDWSGVPLANLLAPGLALEPNARPSLAALREGLAAVAAPAVSEP